MKFRLIAALAIVASCAPIAAALARTRAGHHRRASASTPASCRLGNGSGRIKHVIYLQFDNTHFTRDRENVRSHLEQMPGEPSRVASPAGEAEAGRSRRSS